MVPTFNPLTCHWYAGDDPPLDGVAVKVTLVPWQTGFSEVDIVMLTGWLGSTFIVIGFDMAGLPVAQVALEESMQVMISPFDGA